MLDTLQHRQQRILVTDYAWDSLDVEESVLTPAHACLVPAKTGQEDELVSLASNVAGILTCWKPVTERVIKNAPHCLTIGRYGVGLDNIDVSFATKCGIVVTNVPSYCVEEVSDHAMALILSLARKIAFYDRAIKAGVYDLGAQRPIYRIEGKTLGIVGFGAIGKALYRKARGFGLQILAHDRNLAGRALEGFEVTLVDLPDLLRKSDYISIHVPLTPETRHLFNLEAFRQMKPSAFLVNTARGDIVDPKSLLEALTTNLIAGVGLDVLSQEPPEALDPLILHPKTIITPHAAFNSEESVRELRQRAATQIADVLSGRLPAQVVNPEVLGQSNLRAKLDRT